MLIFSCNFQNRLWHCCRKEYCLMLLWQVFEHCLDVLPKTHVEHLICLVEHYCLYMVRPDCLSPEMIHKTPRSSDNNLHTALKCLNLTADILSSVYRKYLHTMHIFCKLPDFICHLDGKLPCRREDDNLCLVT